MLVTEKEEGTGEISPWIRTLHAIAEDKSCVPGTQGSCKSSVPPAPENLVPFTQLSQHCTG